VLEGGICECWRVGYVSVGGLNMCVLQHQNKDLKVESMHCIVGKFGRH